MGQPEQAESNDVVRVVSEEDVLEPDALGSDDEHHPEATPRTWRRGGDFAAVALIVVAVVVASLVLYSTSDAVDTTSQVGPSQATPLIPVTSLPPTLAEAWRASSGATPLPVAADGVVVTGDGGEVVGHDALTGEVRWRYARDRQLCTVSLTWGKVIAAHTKGTNCSEITTLELASGQRGPQRNGDAETGTRLLAEGSHVVTTGETYMEVYRREDLVRALEYGKLRAIVNPGKQPRVGCTYGSFAVVGGKVALIERCPHQDPADRLTVLKPNPEKSDEPQVLSSTVVGGTGARVIAVSPTRVAVALPGRLEIYDAETGGLLSEVPVEVTADELAGDPPGRVASTYTSTANVYWFTGSKTIALAGGDLTPLWTKEGTIGPGTTLAGRVLLPVRDGLLVVGQTTGAEEARYRLDRGGFTGTVEMATEGPVVLEQRGDTLVALR
ncbi:hypothetical protein GCM10022243_40490 [Saccharothrix violaceirubra]|uniref:Outer membrane protein assembly factor BamB n=1 Tax=Saccharothrix violaceirubra TaxID=413306 RepID=A0A7W7T830_9PSEU|nr:PQQ-binding-like beta-propeller repeat protein [Saccharothrix violaceirubra]MBB4968304.1 outer membrane protein assembly factor BamB [Saccharothrix violaceirubra]